MQTAHPQSTEGAAGFIILTLCLAAAALALPPLDTGGEAGGLLLTLGMLAAWRYSWGMTNVVRSLYYRKIVFPRWRAAAEAGGDALMPSRIYFLMTSFKIDTSVSIRTIRAMVEEAARCGIPAIIIASIVEKQDERLFKDIFHACNPPERVRLKIVRIPGTGKRDGLAHGFFSISRDMPPQDAVVMVVDGDTALLPGVVRKTVPFFKLNPQLGALTTDEVCEVTGSTLMRHWHEMRFAQRHVYMSSVGLSRRVMTLTGRMSAFRADVVTHPDFIMHMQNDYLDHSRLGKFRFLTGDDKSSLYWVMQRGYEQLYVPDAEVLTIEKMPASNFIGHSTQLMLRWFGNMLRTNARIVGLSPWRMPFFVWWSFVDQRISMWTTLCGPIFTVMLSFRFGPAVFAWYAVWVVFVRCVMSVVLLTARPVLQWRYPFLLYYSHIYGSLLKIWALFRLDRQSWTQQKTKLDRNMSAARAAWNTWSSHAVHAASLCLLVFLIGVASETLIVPHAAVRMVMGPEAYPWMP